MECLHGSGPSITIFDVENGTGAIYLSVFVLCGLYLFGSAEGHRNIP